VISFVGAGPGAPDLLTVRAVQRLQAADVVVWAGSLVSTEVMQHCRADAAVHDSKDMTLEQVCGVFAANPDAAIVRLHSGDPTVFSAIGEQIAWCIDHDREFEIVPGVSSFSTAAASAGCEVTIPGVSQTVVLTRLASGTSASMPERETIHAFAATGATLAIFLSVRLAEQLVEQLLAAPSAYTPDTPVVVAHRVSWPDERVVRCTIGTLATTVAANAFAATTLFLVGPALGGPSDCRSHVYAASYATRFRAATAGST
jgi:precorrin-4/cobalt-precorrin-4 C11-methyltransferase